VTRRTDDELPLPEGAWAQPLSDDLTLLAFVLPEAELPDALTLAEQEVALQVYAGASHRDIAETRGVSVKTIGNQLDSIYRKLGVSSRIELVLRLRR
jgi:LuxR family transcriptional regulator, maltose regulon positive regulatory protein